MVVYVILAMHSRSHIHVRLYDIRLYIQFVGELTGLLRPEDRGLRPAFSINAETMLTADSLEKTLTGSGSINEMR